MRSATAVAGIFDRMPPHTPRGAVIEAAAAAREAGADLIATIGGGSVTDGAKAVQLCLANDIRTRGGARQPASGRGTGRRPRAAALQRARGAADHGADDIVGGRVQRHCRRHRRAASGQGAVPPPADHPAHVMLDPAVTVHTPEWLWLSTGIRAVDHCVEGICSGEANPFADAQASARLGAAHSRSASRQV